MSTAVPLKRGEPAVLRGACDRHALVSLLVSFGYVPRCSAHTTWNGRPRSQTLLTCDEPSRADLESVWGDSSRSRPSASDRVTE